VNIKVGDSVVVKQQKQNKFTIKFDIELYWVTKIKGTMVTGEKLCFELNKSQRTELLQVINNYV
jgi:hypothetical protein